MRVDWVWSAEPVGWFISVDGWAFGPMKFNDLFRLARWLIRAALNETNHEARRRMLITFDKVKDVKRAEMERLIARSDICTPGNDLYSFKITTRMFQ